MTMTIPADERHPVFAYGTLRPTWWNARVWRKRATYCHDGYAVLLGYRLVGTAFPYAVPATTAQTVGTLIHPDDRHYDDVLAEMDRLEGVDHGHYERIRVAVLTPDGPCFAWLYRPTAERAEWVAVTLPEVPRNEAGHYDWNATATTH